jgi:putative FmdB family regulatory protein
MPEYVFRCPRCDTIIEISRPIKQGPPAENPICCETKTKRVYLPVSVKFVGDGFSCSGRFDRPDERLDKEIKASMTHDPVTGEEWETRGKRLEKKRAHFGETMRKEFVLPQKEEP